MKYGVKFSPQGWEDFKSWLDDKPMRKRIERLIEDLRHDPDGTGIGKRELLRGILSGWRSARITDEHRLIYRTVGDTIEILACRGHYDK